MSSEGIKLQVKKQVKLSLFHILFYAIEVCFLIQMNESNSDNKNHPDV